MGWDEIELVYEYRFRWCECVDYCIYTFSFLRYTYMSLLLSRVEIEILSFPFFHSVSTTPALAIDCPHSKPHFSPV
jgi:hypothetical protein